MKTSGSPSTAQSRFLQLLGLPRALLLFFGALSLSSGAFAASFAKGDLVEVTREAPLYFKEATLVRTAQKGERFTVLAARPDTHRVFVSAKDAFGQDIALNLSEDALVVIKGSGPVKPSIPAGQNPYPPALAARADEATRKAALLKNGGSDASEKAVIAGLRWLVKSQSRDGSWSDSFTGAMTGFSLLCFLGHGETNTSAEFGPTVEKGIKWLLDKGKADEGVLADRAKIDDIGAFTHAINTLALGEYYTMTKDERAAEIFTKAIKLILDGQGPDGGWTFAYEKSASNTPVTGWQIQALQIAVLSGLKIEGVDAALDKAIQNLRSRLGPDGSFGARNIGDDQCGATGIGVFCTYSRRRERDESVLSGLRFIMVRLANSPVEYKDARADLHAWYFNSQAIFQVSGASGAEWRKSNRMFRDQLIINQRADGSWSSMEKSQELYASLQKDERGAGPYYRTCLSILMLEVYYRYIFQWLGPRS